MNILILGANGQLGWELVRSLQPLGHVLACGRRRADLSDPPALAALVAEARPGVVVNAAAYTAVDRAEREPDLALTINGLAPGVLADAARRAGALFVHYSTDYVLDGSGSAPRDESAPVGPLNIYGRSKLAGEERVATSGSDWLVLRTSWVYAARGQNFVRTMLRLGAERESLRVVADQVGAPTSARLIADASVQVIRQALEERRQGCFEPELLHLCAGGEASWHGFAQAIFEGWRALASADSGNGSALGDAALKLNELTPIPTSEYSTAAARPLNSRLDCSRLRERYGVQLPNWRIGLALVLDELAGR